MSQYDFGNMDPDTTDGTELANILSQFRDAVFSGHKGPAAPTYAQVGMGWIDDSDTPWALKKCAAVTPDVTWVVVGYIDPSGPTFSLVDHTHATGDLPVATDTVAKALASAVALLTPANLAAVLNDHGGFPGGKNLIINGNMQVAQRGAASLSNSYQFGKVDMFEVKADGTVGAGSITQVVGNADLDSKGTYIDITGVTLSGGSEKLYLRTVLESADIYHLYGGYASFQFRLWHDVGSTLNASVKIDKAGGGTDNWSSESNVHTEAITLANGWNTIKVENVSMGDCRGGLTISVEITTGAITSKRFQVGKWQLERGSVCTSMEFRPFADELAKCQRFFDKSYEYATAPGAVTLSGCLETTYRGSNRFYDQAVEKFKQRMRVAPTVTVYSTQTGASGKCSDLTNDYTATVQNLSERGFFIICAYPTANTEIYWHWAASAKIR